MKWPLTDKKEIFRSEYFQEDQRLAQKAGLNLADPLDQAGIVELSLEIMDHKLNAEIDVWAEGQKARQVFGMATRLVNKI